MTFLMAIKQNNWVKRVGWPRWIVVKDGYIGRYLMDLTKVDLLAADWIAYEYIDEPIETDDSSVRFELIELE